MITITRAPPYLTVQNGGRRQSRSSGVPPGGAMDFFALGATNAIVGNPLEAAVLEWALGGGALRFDRDSVFAIGGATARTTLSGKLVAPWSTTYAHVGDELRVEQIERGRFLYLAFDGGVEVPVLLGSRSTYLPGRFGGYQGRLIRTADSIALGPGPATHPKEGFHCAADLMPRYDTGVVHVTRGPQASTFDESAWRTLTESEFRVSIASDRTGYKLEGPSLGKFPSTLPSEAGCPGSIQVPGDGFPIALMADAPTIGGYAKIAVASEADLPLLAQRRPGEIVRFELTTIEQSQRALRRRHSDMHAITQLAAASSSH